VVDGRSAFLTVRFRSEMIHALLDRDGVVREGDEKAVREVEDVWTFEKDVMSRDPNWKLVATDDDLG
jgi:predicted lipid-binding transport protein (Tim44 family)